MNSDFPARLINAFRVPLITDDLLNLPSLEAMAKSQSQTLPAADSGYTRSSTPSGEIWIDKAGKIFFPDDDEELQLRICFLPTAVSEVIEDWRPPPRSSRICFAGLPWMPTSKRLFRTASYALCVQLAPIFLSRSVGRFTPLLLLSFCNSIFGRLLRLRLSEAGQEY